MGIIETFYTTAGFRIDVSSRTLLCSTYKAKTFFTLITVSIGNTLPTNAENILFVSWRTFTFAIVADFIIRTRMIIGTFVTYIVDTGRVWTTWLAHAIRITKLTIRTFALIITEAFYNTQRR